MEWKSLGEECYELELEHGNAFISISTNIGDIDTECFFEWEATTNNIDVDVIAAAEGECGTLEEAKAYAEAFLATALMLKDAKS